MKLSIIIPVYQVAGTLSRCLDSLSDQSFRDWQAILVDDASSDGSANICDEYVKHDHRFQVVHLRRNSGLSAARNVGLEKARGQYITFVDSDDYIADDSLKTLFEILATHPDYDLLEYPVYERYGSSKIHLLQFQRREYSDPLAYWLEGKAYLHAYSWNKIYRKEVFDKVKFPERRNFEDIYTLPSILRNCHMMATTDVGLYY
ncbi:MAG: glycosyltransferase, partial [Bacteroidota bacterium]|nr:glycosyltransferase [Bacteroidota bacterium]